MGWGAVRASEVVEGKVGERFERFVTALLERRVVPLLGAGASADSAPPTKDLLPALKAKLKAPFDGADAGDGDFNRVAEALQWQRGAAALCDELGIADWANAAPTRAHRYLALLAWEGLVTEVITTNYDCGLDKAWLQAGPAPDGWRAIATAEDLSQPRPRWGNACLRLYKINGCAARLRDAPLGLREQRADEILLTDLQLQQFGKRRWAGDLLRVLLRDHEVMLSGFGSEEPQVWHLVMDILGEFAEKEKRPNPNARFLWVATYKDRILFPLLQALNGENRVRERPPLRFDNVFSADDRAFFDGGCTDGLDAGDFWRRVWLEAIRRGLADEKGPVARYFGFCVSGRPWRPRGSSDRKMLAIWDEVVQAVFREPIDWLTEPTRPNGSSRWAKDGDSPAEADAPSAPGLACCRVSGGGTRYLPLAEEPKYWVSALMFLLARSYKTARMEAVDGGDGPEVRVVWGRGELRIDGAALVEAGTVVRRGEGNVVFVVPVPMPERLGENWQPVEGLDKLAALLRRRLEAHAIQWSRKAEAEPRESRRSEKGKKA